MARIKQERSPKRSAANTALKLIIAIDFGTTFSGVAWAQTANVFSTQKLLCHTAPCATYPATRLTVDYLRSLRQHIETLLYFKLGAGVVESTAIRYVITVPAIWTDAAKELTRKCALEAGFRDDPYIVSEPEAAITYALQARKAYLNKGDTFVMCDAGGGTVDLITYEIDEIKPFKVKEAVAGSGHKCGSIYLNRIFSKYIRDHYAQLPGWGEDTHDEALAHFEERTKRSFADQNSPVTIPVLGLLNNKDLAIARGKLTLPGATIARIFEPVISTIPELVKAQVAASSQNVKAVLLVGGFGQSPYLRNMIKATVGEDIEVITPTQGWTAVVRGATIMGVSYFSPEYAQLNVSSRIARKSYGTVESIRYLAGIHEDNRKQVFSFSSFTDRLTISRFWDGYEGCYLIDVINWKVLQGDELREDEPLVVGYYYITRKKHNGRFGSHKDEIYTYQSMTADDLPLYEEQGLTKLAVLESDLSSIPMTKLEEVMGEDGKAYYRINFEIRAKFESAHIDYSLWFKGKCYGSVEANYN